MGANFSPVFNQLKPTGVFKYWCSKVLPAVYDDSLSYYELLCKVVNSLSDVISNMDTTNENVANLFKSYTMLEDYVNLYFTNLDVQSEINNKLDSMVEDGTLDALISNLVMAIFNITSVPYLNYIYDLAGEQEVVIGFLGDSLTFGTVVGSEEASPNNYPAVLQRYFTDLGINAVTKNYGEVGYPSDRYSEQMELALADNCNIISFSFGSNDFRIGYGTDRLLKNISEFVETCKTKNITPIVTDVPPYWGTQADRYKNGRSVSDSIKLACQKLGAIFVPLYESYMSMYDSGCYSPINMQTDGVHFKDYTLSADIFAQYAFPILCAEQKGQLKTAWRNSGLSFSNMTISDVGFSYNSRVANLKSNSTWSLSFYSDKPFDLYSVTGDYVASAQVQWGISGFGFNGNVVLDYYRAGESTVTKQRKTLIKENLPAGRYTLKMNSLTRGAAPTAYTPLLYLCGISVEQKEQLITLE